ncbi:MAG: MBL fold metallo-hydrolase [Candidatus Baltobacteraceae bacterium]
MATDARVLFLGSGGARFVVARQLRASGGMWFHFGSTQVQVDPGPGALVRALSHVPALNPRELDAIVLSHKHLDHAGDINAMIEAMTAGGFRRRGALFAPRDAFEGASLLQPYAAAFVERCEMLEPSGTGYRVGEVNIASSPRHHHAVETLGIHFEYRGLRVAYLPCGRYDEAIVADYAAQRPDVLIVNVLRFEDTMQVDHLTWPQACSIVASVRPSLAIFQHFGTKMLEQNPARLAQEVEDELGLRAIAAYDGLEIDLVTQVAAVRG